MTIELNVLQTTGLAMLLFVLGRFIVNHVGFLRRCCIPAPVVGGLIFAIFHLVVHQTGLLTLTFDETLVNPPKLPNDKLNPYFSPHTNKASYRI